MIWGRSRETGDHTGVYNNHNIRIKHSLWGNSNTPAWEIFIDGRPHGKELTIRDAKLEALREVKLSDRRAGF